MVASGFKPQVKNQDGYLTAVWYTMQPALLMPSEAQQALSYPRGLTGSSIKRSEGVDEHGWEGHTSLTQAAQLCVQ